MAAWTYAMEAMTTVTAGLIDRGLDDYMLETAMLKVYSTEALWTIVNDAFQIYGGPAYFTDQPLERILRDARINLIGEGANEVLTSFIALVGMRDPGEELRAVRDSLCIPGGNGPCSARFAARGLLPPLAHGPRIPVQSPELRPYARTVSRLIHRFGLAVVRTLIGHREAILDRQLVQEPIAQAAMELFASVCVLSRRDAELCEARPQRSGAGRLGAGGGRALPRAVGPPHPASPRAICTTTTTRPSPAPPPRCSKRDSLRG